MPPSNELGFSRFLVRCERSFDNNGTVNVTFIRRAVYSDHHSQEEALSGVLMRERGPYKEHEHYWITIEPATPRG